MPDFNICNCNGNSLKNYLEVINFSSIRRLGLRIAKPCDSKLRIDAKMLIDLMRVIGKKQWEFLWFSVCPTLDETTSEEEMEEIRSAF